MKNKTQMQNQLDVHAFGLHLAQTKTACSTLALVPAVALRYPATVTSETELCQFALALATDLLTSLGLTSEDVQILGDTHPDNLDPDLYGGLLSRLAALS